MSELLSWKRMLNRLRAIERRGYELKDTDGQRIRGSGRSSMVQYVRGYPFPYAINKLIKWIRDFEVLLGTEGRDFAINRIDRLLREMADTSLSCISDLKLTDFAPLPEDIDGEPDYDYFTMLEGFDFLLKSLIRETKALQTHSEVAELRPCSVRSDSDFLSITELANRLRIRRTKVIQDVCRFKKQNKSDPIWVRRLPGRQRGFMIHWPTYESLMRAGDERAPAFRRAIR